MGAREYRKLQHAGKAAYSITLPKRWVAERGLKPGDILLITEEMDGSIRVQLPLATSPQIICTINAELCRAPGLLSRLLVGCYNQGYDTVRIVSESGLRAEQVREASHIVDRLPGFEIVEQTRRRIIVQSFIDPSKFPLEGLLKRLQVMVATMLNNLIDFMGSEDWRLLNQVEEIEEKVDQLYFLTVRLILLYLKRRELGEPLGIESPAFAAGARVVIKTLEEIADNLLYISEELASMKSRRSRFRDEEAEKLRKLFETTYQVFGKTMKAFFSLDMKLANEVIEEVSRVFGVYRRGVKEVIELDDPKLIRPIRYILNSLGYIAKNCKVIAEVAFNRFVRMNTPIVTLNHSTRRQSFSLE